MNRDKGQAGYVYILTNQGNSVLYIGVTTNLLKRVYQHKRKYLRGFTERYNLNKLVYYEIFIDIASARDRERKIKGWKREKKIDLISTMNPNWKNLYDNLEKDPSASQLTLITAKRPQDASFLIGKAIQGGI